MNSITIVGNLTADPELKFTQNGAAVANFSVADTPRQFDKASGEWRDGETLFLRCSLWRDQAENVAESLTRGTRVIITGKLKSRSYEKDAQTRTVIELDVEEIGPSLKYARATVSKIARNGASSAPAPTAAGSGWGTSTDEAPF